MAKPTPVPGTVTLGAVDTGPACGPPGKRMWDPRKSVVERTPNQLVLSCEQPGIMTVPHWHAQAEVNYIFRGSLVYEIHGLTVRLSAGQMALFWGGVPHRVIDTEVDTYFHAIHLPLIHFFRLRLSSRTQQRLMSGAILISSNAAADDDAAFLRREEQLMSQAPRVANLALDELLLRIERLTVEPHHVIEPPGSEAGTDSGELPSFQGLNRISRFIAENFREDIDSVDIAVSADIHPKYAMSIFKKSTGMSLGDYVTLMRISYAQSRLCAQEESIIDIAMDSGFGSLSAFNKAFRKRTGQTPSEFRRQRMSAALDQPQGE
ncbi:helix-turn-helix domain-containing protein [Paracoccus sp. IB05]|uniref:helix-turn-helix domain-containing protein n=1 Tax=Paracoccus sp. IB05 TaxID=2779367 RepID=UPI0018E88D44|nr:helix-turn-helix domain-containing protein [Paracoccus sp. IB05]